MKKKKIVFAIDQSYARSGICIMEDGKIIYSGGLAGTITDKKMNKTIYRRLMADFISTTIEKYRYSDEYEIVPILEAIRPYNLNYIVPTGALYGAIIDAFYPLDVFTVGTSTWKSKVLKKSKIEKGEYEDEIEPKKMPAILHVTMKYGIDCIERNSEGTILTNRKGQIKYNDDMADAICIAEYGFTEDAKIKLKRLK